MIDCLLLLGASVFAGLFVARTGLDVAVGRGLAWAVWTAVKIVQNRTTVV